VEDTVEADVDGCNELSVARMTINPNLPLIPDLTSYSFQLRANPKDRAQHDFDPQHGAPRTCEADLDGSSPDLYKEISFAVSVPPISLQMPTSLTTHALSTEWFQV
jgi:hypothetical protein